MLDATIARLASAQRSKDPAAIGEANLDVAEALIETYDVGMERPRRVELLARIQVHLKGALEAFTQLRSPLRAAHARLQLAACAAEFAGLAVELDDRKRSFGQAVELTGDALTAIFRYGSTHFDLLIAACTQALGISGRLRQILGDQEAHQAIDELIGGVSDLLGEALAADFNIREQGVVRGQAAKLTELLAELAQDPDERSRLLRLGHDLALDAAEMLRRTSDRTDADDLERWAIAVYEAQTTAR